MEELQGSVHALLAVKATSPALQGSLPAWPAAQALILDPQANPRAHPALQAPTPPPLGSLPACFVLEEHMGLVEVSAFVPSAQQVPMGQIQGRPL